jgi:hypothetical protein
MEKYTLGHTFEKKFLTKDDTRRTRVTKITKKPYGYRVQMFNNYITLFYVKLETFEDGSAKATVRVEQNYRKPYQYTLYFAPESGKEITTATNSTRAELSIWKELRNIK